MTALDNTVKMSTVAQQITDNDPPVEVGQVWEGVNEGKIMRRIMILAPYPECGMIKPKGLDHKLWLYQELSGGTMKIEIGRLGICPEFNLRFIFQLAP